MAVANDAVQSMIDTTTGTIANGASLSGSIDMGGGALARIIMPGAWTAAVITLAVSYDGTVWGDLYDRFGNEYTIQAAASRSILIPIADLAGVRYIKLRSGTSGTPVNQAADRAFTLVRRAV